MTSSITNYKLLTSNVSRTMTQLSSQPEIKREVEYYKANISKIKSVDDFLGNQRIYNFAMTAFGMKDLIYAKGMIRKVLTEGVDSKNAFAMTLTDQRFRDLATTFDFKKGANLYAHYYESQAMMQRSSSEWKRYNDMFRDQLLNNQNSDGSWGVPPGNPHVKDTLFSTCLCTLMMEVYYRFLSTGGAGGRNRFGF